MVRGGGGEREMVGGGVKWGGSEGEGGRKGWGDWGKRERGVTFLDWGVH